MFFFIILLLIFDVIPFLGNFNRNVLACVPVFSKRNECLFLIVLCFHINVICYLYSFTINVLPFISKRIFSVISNVLITSVILQLRWNPAVK